MALTTQKINAARPCITPVGRKTAKPYKIGDSRGLYLEVTPTGSKRWRLKYRFAGKEKRLSLGIYPEVSLAGARGKRDQIRSLLSSGTDPSEHIRKSRAAQRADKARQLVATRFVLDSDGALSFRLGNRRLILTPAETVELRIFLDATRTVTPRD